MFPFNELNFLSVVIATLFSFMLGALWYGPLFGKIWLAHTKKYSKADFDKKEPMAPHMALALVNTLISMIFIGALIVLTGAKDWLDALLLATYGTVAFTSFLLLGEVNWEKKPFALYLIAMGFYFLSATGGAIIMTVMR